MDRVTAPIAFVNFRADLEQKLLTAVGEAAV